MEYKEIQIVKIGSQALFRDQSKLDFNNIDDLCLSLRYLRDQRKIATVIVTSGAIALGKQFINLKGVPDKILQGQMLAAIGQPELMRLYSLNLNEKVAQLLFTHSTLINKNYRLKIRRLILALLKAKIFPIINYNDSIDDVEINQVSTYADNDRVAEEIASILKAKRLILLTTEDGVLSSHGEIIERVSGRKNTKNIFSEIKNYCIGKSVQGTGGMISKISVAENLYKQGIQTIIGNVKYPVHFLLDGHDDKDKRIPRTVFNP